MPCPVPQKNAHTVLLKHRKIDSQASLLSCLPLSSMLSGQSLNSASPNLTPRDIKQVSITLTPLNVEWLAYVLLDLYVQHQSINGNSALNVIAFAFEINSCASLLTLLCYKWAV